MANLDANIAPFPYFEMDPNACVCGAGGGATSAGLIGAVFAPPSATSKLGTDIDGIFDTGAMLSLASDLKNIGNAICRRLITPRGSLFYDLGYGFDVRSFLNMGFTPDKLATLQSQITDEVEKDERIQSADVTVDINISAMTMAITIVAEIAERSYVLILSVDKLTAKLLSAETQS